jgi:hypothetical protein
LVSGLGDRAGSALSHCLPQPCLPVDIALCMVCSDCIAGHGSVMATTVSCLGFAPIHLRRFCRISLTDRVPDESMVRKLTRRIGSETVSETLALIVKATREEGFRPRCGSTRP